MKTLWRTRSFFCFTGIFLKRETFLNQSWNISGIHWRDPLESNPEYSLGLLRKDYWRALNNLGINPQKPRKYAEIWPWTNPVTDYSGNNSRKKKWSETSPGTVLEWLLKQPRNQLWNTPWIHWESHGNITGKTLNNGLAKSGWRRG